MGSARRHRGRSATSARPRAGIRKLSDDLDARMEIVTNIARFSGSGLRQYEALAADGRRTLEDISRAVRSLEKNPSQIIFGNKPALPEYKAR